MKKSLDVASQGNFALNADTDSDIKRPNNSSTFDDDILLPEEQSNS